MTGSAKQSIGRHSGWMDCFVASAPRNDERSVVMAGHSRLKDGVASAPLCPGHPRLRFARTPKDVDARDKPGHDADFLIVGEEKKLRLARYRLAKCGLGRGEA